MVFKRIFKKSAAVDSREKKPAVFTGGAAAKGGSAPVPASGSNKELPHDTTDSLDWSSSSLESKQLPDVPRALKHAIQDQTSLQNPQLTRSTHNNQYLHHRISSVPTSFLRQKSESNSSQSAGSRRHSGSRHSRSSSAFLDPSALLENSSIPKELVPIITLIQLQQARIYYDDFLRFEGQLVESKLSGTELSFWSQALPELTYINIADATFEYSPLSLEIVLNQQKSYVFEFDTEKEVNFFYSCLLLSQFEYRQLQESFTGLLLSAKGVLLSDIRTLLLPENRHVKTEWCVIRFPFLNNKWIKCYVVVIPGEKTLLKNSTKEKGGKIEIYTSSKTNKKNLLATIINGRSCYSIYPERPEFIDNNALLHITGSVYVNQDKLHELTSTNLAGNNQFQLPKRSSTTSLSSKLLSPVLHGHGHQRSRSRSPSVNNLYHQRSDSLQSLESEASSLSKKTRNVNLVRTQLCLMIPETHPSVKQFDTMIRLLIPVLNVFKLYGRPTKFLSQRDNKDSLLFGLPQLPHTEYMDLETSYKLVELNIKNSVTEAWNSDDWIHVFKEMILFKLTKGFKGSGSVFDVFRDGLVYTKAKDEREDNYISDTELLELFDVGAEHNNGSYNNFNEPNSAFSSPRNTFIDRSRSSSFQNPTVNSRLNSPVSAGATEQQQSPLFANATDPLPPVANAHDYRNLYNQSQSLQGRSPLLNEYYFQKQETERKTTANGKASEEQALFV